MPVKRALNWSKTILVLNVSLVPNTTARLSTDVHFPCSVATKQLPATAHLLHVKAEDDQGFVLECDTV